METLALLVFIVCVVITGAAALTGIFWSIQRVLDLIYAAHYGDRNARVLLAVFTGIAVYTGFFWSIDYLWGI